ncbi:MAG: AMP-binding protein [Gaiellales bacterium]
MPLAAEAFTRGPADPPVLERTVGDVLRGACAIAPDRVALVEGTPEAEKRKRLTYAELLGEAERCARALLGRYEPGDCVAIWAPNVIEYQVVQYGAALAGMPIVTVNPTLRRNEAEHVLGHSRVVACFACDAFRGREVAATASVLADELPALRDVLRLDGLASFLAEGDVERDLPAVRPDQPAQILYTSGTTGSPKGAVLPHLGMVNNAAHAALRITADVHPPVWLAALPMFHLASCVVATIGTASLAGTLVTVPQFDAELGLRLIEEEGVTTTNIVPTLLIAMLDHPSFPLRDHSTLGTVMLGGTSIAPELVRRVHEVLGVGSVIGYGLTEAAVVTMTTIADTVDDQVHTCGAALPGVEVAITDPASGGRLRCDEVGEVWTRGFHTMTGYLHDPAASARALDADGWLRTGDLGALDERGYLRIEGRATEMIIRGGENISPAEVEGELYRLPEILEAAVVGLPDPYYGEIVAAFVRVRTGGNVVVADLAAALRERLTGHKVPTRWFFVDDYPRTSSGKVRKHELRAAWERGELMAEES